MYDICIIGGGIAGLNLSRLCSSDYKTLLIDKRAICTQNNMISQGKLCGGLLAPDAQKEFAVQGLSIPISVLIDPQIFAVKAVDLASKNEAVYQRFYINTDRARLDRWLFSLSQGKADIIENAVVKNIEKCEGYYTIIFNKNGKDQKVKCKIPVGADGAVSKIFRLNKNKQIPKYISVQGAFEAKNPYFMYYSFFDKRLTDFYGWVIPKGDCIIAGFAVSEKDYRNNSFDSYISKIREYGIETGPGINIRSTLIARPSLYGMPCPVSGGIPLIGEAGGFMSSSSAEGISYALKTSYSLYEAIVKDEINFCKIYEQSVRKIILNIYGKIIKSSVYYQPFLRNLAMKSKINTIKIK